jgi:hypothetical protein
LIIGVAVLVYILGELRRIRDLLGQHENFLWRMAPMVSSRFYVPFGGFSIWAYRRGNWELEKEYCQNGFETGPPPRLPGAYEGQCVKKECVPKTAVGSLAAAR